jgi:hypothetical protein
MHTRFDDQNTAIAHIAGPDEMPLRNKRTSPMKAGSASALRIEAAANRIALIIIIVIFAVSVAYLYWKHKSADVASPPSVAGPHHG